MRRMLERFSNFQFRWPSQTNVFARACDGSAGTVQQMGPSHLQEGLWEWVEDLQVPSSGSKSLLEYLHFSSSIFCC